MYKAIKTAVFPVAGLGTRFLPITKSGPKEMLPIIDKPIIQFVVEEAIAAGITHLVFVTSSGKRAIEDYFDSNYELESRLYESGKFSALRLVQNILPSNIHFSYVRQTKPVGLGDAVLCAEAVVGNEPFAVLLPDDIIDCDKKGCLQQMVDIYRETQDNVIAVKNIPPQLTPDYGIVSVIKDTDSKWQRIVGIVEKPLPADAPSTLAVTGRYILVPEIFSILKQTPRGIGGEVQLTDAIAQLIHKSQVIACPFIGKRYDCGSKKGYLEAVIAYALKRPDLREVVINLLCDISMNVASTKEME